MPKRRLSPPWMVEEYTACFIVKDHAGLNLAYVYFESEPSGRPAAKLLSRLEAQPSILWASNVFTPAALKRTMRPFCRAPYVALRRRAPQHGEGHLRSPWFLEPWASMSDA